MLRVLDLILIIMRSHEWILSWRVIISFSFQSTYSSGIENGQVIVKLTNEVVHAIIQMRDGMYQLVPGGRYCINYGVIVSQLQIGLYSARGAVLY